MSMSASGPSAIASGFADKLQATIIKSGMLKTNAGVLPRPSPSLFYFPGITSKPVHNATQFHWARVLEEEYATIKQEFMGLKSLQIDSDYKRQDGEHSLHHGSTRAGGMGGDGRER
ncbi:hypothetical protein NSK_003339 [Nannochloropsis salina CCMP1776]|uniref:Uncharacterized protein n=1 Tax=Nannochloropsis salina CCMP1776 TaxID=1027361 RepID=A0A4D9D1U0_9STRA|nr:hypothetical protein NSK_003339 [Nannochloropsis salina CCMP1776]|eukprot:TFJ85380.1 hypothetical protein NSK_003339 [Nannochloropsis salina CCMP1776]